MVSWEKNIFLWKKTYNSWPFSLMQSYLLLKRFMQNFPQSNEIFFGHVTADILAPFTYYHKGMLLYVAIVCTIQGSLRELYMYHQLSLLKISTPQIFHFLANTHRYLQSRRRATTFDNLSYNNFLPSDSHHKS